MARKMVVRDSGVNNFVIFGLYRAIFADAINYIFRNQ